jgi:hypothetical protein
MSHKFKVNLVVDWEKQKVCLQEPPTGTMRWTIKFNLYNLVVGDNEMAVTITDLQKVSASIQPLDARGNPAPVDGIPAWTNNSPTLLGLLVAADGLSATVSAIGPLGVGQIIVEADADLGTGVETLQGILDVTVVGSQAVTLNILTGIPEPL